MNELIEYINSFFDEEGCSDDFLKFISRPEIVQMALSKNFPDKDLIEMYFGIGRKKMSSEEISKVYGFYNTENLNREISYTTYKYIIWTVKVLYSEKRCIMSVLFGVAVGDALGVPVEFRNREELRKNPVTDMTGGDGSAFNMPAGTWSDDSSLTFCLAESLTQGYNLNDIAFLFTHWLFNNYWTAHNRTFDVGITCEEAITQLARGVQPELAGGANEWDNGNGSLMRILPLLFHINRKQRKERFEIIRQVSSLTHRHIRSVISCFYYLEFARKLLYRDDKHRIYTNLQIEIPDFLEKQGIAPAEIAHFDRLLNGDISQLSENEINSASYVIDTLESSIWCLLTTDSYEEAVLKAVNLGYDTDTTAAVTGGLAALMYGFGSIPKRWLTQLARREDIENLAEKLAVKSYGY
jgi:ADP-ribosylglycohydrolase